jgi:hypothetical protein
MLSSLVKLSRGDLFSPSLFTEILKKNQHIFWAKKHCGWYAIFTSQMDLQSSHPGWHCPE